MKPCKRSKIVTGDIPKSMFRGHLVLIVAALLTGCEAKLPFHYEVMPVIPDSLRVKGSSAKAYAVNDAGDVVGIYSPPAPSNGEQIFIIASGHLARYDYPCDGYLNANIITNAGLIAGYCQSRNGGGTNSFVLSYSQPGPLQPIQSVWPAQGYIVSGLNDRGDAIGWNPKILGSRAVDFLGFIYVSGQLHMVREADLPPLGSFTEAVLNQSGIVVGGKGARLVASGTGPMMQDSYSFIFAERNFSEIRSSLGGVKAINSKGYFVTNIQGPGFGLWDGKFREIDCGKMWCSAADINDQGWVVGKRSTDYPVPPMGASFGNTFLWRSDRFYNIDNSVHLKINWEYPVKLSNAGHILFHSDGWPYLLTPEGLKKHTPQ